MGAPPKKKIFILSLLLNIRNLITLHLHDYGKNGHVFNGVYGVLYALRC